MTVLLLMNGMIGLFDSSHHTTLLGISFVTVIQFAIIAVIGGGTGIVLGAVIHSHPEISRAITNVMRIGMWIPVFLLWFIPVTRDGNLWLHWVLPSIAIITISSVITATLRDYLIRSSLLGLSRRDVLRWALKTALVQTVVVCVFSQPMMSGAGWHWYYGSSRALLSTILVGITLFIIEYVPPSNFDVGSSISAKRLLAELGHDTFLWIMKAGIALLCLLCIWQLLAMTRMHAVISSPLDVYSSLSTLLAARGWTDLYVSTGEMFSGMLVGVALAMVVNEIFKILPIPKDILFAGVPLLFLTPLMALTILSTWFFQQGPWPKIAAVALLCLFPMLEVFWGTGRYPTGFRILMGLDQALPFAFLALLFSESMAATQGLGFLLVDASRVSRGRSEGLAVVLVITFLLTVYSCVLRFIAKYRYSVWISTDNGRREEIGDIL